MHGFEGNTSVSEELTSPLLSVFQNARNNLFRRRLELCRHTKQRASLEIQKALV